MTAAIGGFLDMVAEIKNEADLSANDRSQPIKPDQISKILRVGDLSQEYERFRSCYVGSDLFALFDGLVSPVMHQELELDALKIDVKVVKHDSPLGETASDIVNFAYNSRYIRNGGDVVDMATDAFDIQGTSEIIIAQHETGNESLVLATFRVVYGEDLDVFRLFEAGAPDGWPHVAAARFGDTSSLHAGELGRFSLHPVFDIIGNPDNPVIRAQAKEFKQKVLREMWPQGMNHLAQKEVTHPYFILAPYVRDFVDSAGIKPTKVEGVTPSNSDYSLGVRYKFKEYWKPDADPAEQPKVYLAPWEVAPEAGFSV